MCSNCDMIGMRRKGYVGERQVEMQIPEWEIQPISKWPVGQRPKTTTKVNRDKN